MLIAVSTFRGPTGGSFTKCPLTGTVWQQCQNTCSKYGRYPTVVNGVRATHDATSLGDLVPLLRRARLSRIRIGNTCRRCVNLRRSAIAIQRCGRRWVNGPYNANPLLVNSSESLRLYPDCRNKQSRPRSTCRSLRLPPCLTQEPPL